MSKIVDTLVESLFIGTAETIRAALAPLSEAERKALFKTVGPILDAAANVWAGKHHENLKNAIPRYDHGELFKIYLDAPDEFHKAPWIHRFQPISYEKWIPFRSALRQFFLRARCLRVGLGPKPEVVAALKRTYRDGVRPLDDEPDMFVTWTGRVLLDRPEAWVKSLFLDYCDKIERWSDFWWKSGLATVVVEARRRFPEWRDELEPAVRKAMLVDGFHRDDWADVLEPDMILTGLDTDSAAASVFNGLPIQTDSCVQQVLGAVASGFVPRADALDLAYRKVLSPLKDQVCRAWIAFLEKLEPTDDEKRERRETYLDMINAAFGPVADMGLKEIRRQWAAGLIESRDVAPLVGGVLHHGTQGTAVEAFQFVKKLVERDESLFSELLPVVLDALSTPHRKLRDAMSKWIKQNQSKLTDMDIVRLVEFTAELRPSERADFDWLPAESPAAIESVEASEPATEAPTEAALPENASALARRRFEFVQHWRTTGAVGELVPEPPDFSYALEIDVERFSSAEAVAEKLIEYVSGKLTPLDYERLIDGIRRFPDGPREERVEKLLRPILERFDLLNASYRDDPQKAFGKLAADWHDVIAFRLAAFWQNPSKPPVFKPHSVGRNYDTAQAGEHAHLNAMLEWLPSMKTDCLLSLPTHSVGWIHPEILAERVTRTSPGDIVVLDLARALHRLAPSSEARRNAWTVLHPWAEADSGPLGRALTLALGPDEAAQAAMSWFRSYFEASPPDDRLYWQHYQGAPAKKLIGIIHRVDDLGAVSPNLIFRLFLAALRARFGLGDARVFVGELPKQRLKMEGRAGNEATLGDLLIAVSEGRKPSKKDFPYAKLDGMYYIGKQMFHEDEITALRYVLDTLLWFPEPIRSEPPCAFYRTDTPQYPYLAAHFLAYGGSAIGGGETSLFPLGAQRLYEAGVRGLEESRARSHDPFQYGFDVTLLGTSRLPHVRIEPTIFKALLSCVPEMKPDLRERVLELVLAWFNDGRATPSALAEALADVLRATDKGFKNMDDLLVSMTATSRAGSFLALLAIEKTLAGGVDAMPPRSLSALLDRYVRMLEDMDRAVDDPNVEAVLRTLAGANRKSASTDKAKAILARRKSATQAPVEVEIVSALLA